MPDFSVVIGVDRRTLDCLRLVLPTWQRQKPSLYARPWHIFYDSSQVNPDEIRAAAPIPTGADFVAWPPAGVAYVRDGLTKWANPQRAKMLAGFVHVPAMVVQTPYWLKIDLDVVAVGCDGWIDPDWFDGNPSIIAPSWGYTKPPDQMQKLDAWVEKYEPLFLRSTEPLNLIPTPGADTLPHSRICSWCAFFSTEFTKICSYYATQTLGLGQIPVDSQDGFHFYCAKRAGFSIRVIRPKKHGWHLCSSPAKVRDFVESMPHV